MVLSGMVGGSNPHAYGHRELLFMGVPSVPLESSRSNLKIINLILNGMWQGDGIVTSECTSHSSNIKAMK